MSLESEVPADEPAWRIFLRLFLLFGSVGAALYLLKLYMG